MRIDNYNIPIMVLNVFTLWFKAFLNIINGYAANANTFTLIIINEIADIMPFIFLIFNYFILNRDCY